eukprot:249546-Prymnesium_polylepis.1
MPAFEELFAQVDWDVPTLLREAQAAGIDSLVSALAFNAPLATALHAAAERTQQHYGGMYDGRLDHLRSTLCLPALGIGCVPSILGCVPSKLGCVKPQH